VAQKSKPTRSKPPPSTPIGKPKPAKKPKRAEKSRADVVARSETLVHDGALKVAKRTLNVPAQDGRMMEGIEREIVRRPDAAAALVHDVKRDKILLAEVFRFPAYDRGEAGWLREIVAGVVEANETPEACIRRELMEEVGYNAPKLIPIAAIYASPGYSTERIHIFYAPVRPKDSVDPAAHGVDKGEDVVRVWLSRKAFLKSLDACADAKTLIAGQWLRGK
jgi:nudix-type nucleoside diphosphatase (YffH/AdpP family)